MLSTKTSPKTLRPGDKVAVVATARRVKPADVSAAIDILKEWGLTVVESPYLFSASHSYLAGSDVERIEGIQQFMDDESISAIVCARGGYGTTRIIDELSFEQFLKFPKWLVGFSDITALHLKLAAIGVQSIHATMPILFGRQDSGSSIESLRSVLFENSMFLSATADINNKPGNAIGELIGGNLSLLVDSLGTSYEPDTNGKILVLEEIDEYLYKIDRMIVQLKRAGKLSNLAGLVVGHFTDIKETELKFGETYQEIIRYHTADFPYPVGFHFPTGHENPNLAWISGARAILKVGYQESNLKIDAVS